MLQIRKIGFKFLAGLAIVALLYPFLYTMSRTGYAGLLLGLLVYGILKKREVIAILLVGIVLFLLTAPESIFIRAATTISVLTERPDASYAARVAQWKVSMSDIMESPLFGKGLGFVNFGDVDNEYVRVAVDCGLLGVFALAWLLIAIIIQAFRMHKEIADEDDFYKSYVVGYSISVFSILILCWGVTCLSTIRTMEMFMVLTGLFYALVANYRRWRRPFMPPPEEPEFAYVEERPKPTSRT
jgi:O-antigen ligase